jgi:hypothetical protein
MLKQKLNNILKINKKKNKNKIWNLPPGGIFGG